MVVSIGETCIRWAHQRARTVETVDLGELKKTNSVVSVGKGMATVFWASQAVIYINSLKKGKTVLGSTLPIRRRIVEKSNTFDKVLFHHVNTSAHRLTDVTTTNSRTLVSPDWSPNDIVLLQIWKSQSTGRNFSQVRSLSPPRRPALKSARKHTFFPYG